MKINKVLILVLCCLYGMIYTKSKEHFFALQDIDKATKIIDIEGMWTFEEGGAVYPVDNISTSPTIKIVTSSVELDFKKLSITNGTVTQLGFIGIEVGYSPAELAANPLLKQPSNIVIRNGSLKNFDCGILIHKGVKHVSIENVEISDCSLGIVAAGESGGQAAGERVLEINIDNVTITGHSLHHYVALSHLKLLIEETYGYGTDTVFPLRKDPLNNNQQDVFSYIGFLGIYVRNINIRNTVVNNIGYSNYNASSEGDEFRTESLGIVLRNSDRIVIDHSKVTECYSEVKSVGLQIEYTSQVKITHSQFSHNNSNVKTVGIETFSESPVGFVGEEITLHDVRCELNRSEGIVIGADMCNVRGLYATEWLCKINTGDKQAYGMWSKNLQQGDIRRSSFSRNLADRALNDVATNEGIISTGFYLEASSTIEFQDVDFCCNTGLNTGRGCYVKNTNDVKCINCQFIRNEGTQPRSGEAAQIIADQAITEISKFSPVVDSTKTGGYGFVCHFGQRIKMDDCLSVSNQGHRSSGLCFENSQSVLIKDTFCSAQIATGFMLDSSFTIDNALAPYDIDILLPHKSLLFSSFLKSNVHAVNAVDLFLEKIALIREAQKTESAVSYDDEKVVTGTIALLQSAIARYRLWGTACGIHLHNCIGSSIQNCGCFGQISLFDNAMGVCFSGRNRDHLVEECRLSYNIAWYLSRATLATNGTEQYRTKYDLSGMKGFWSTITNPWSSYKSFGNLSDVLSVAFSPDGTKLAMGDANNEVKIYETSTWTLEQTLAGHTGSVNAVAWSSDGTALASGSADNTVKVWNTSTWVADQTLAHGTGAIVNALAWKSDNTFIASGGDDNTIKIWNTSTWIADQTLTHGTAAVVNALTWKSDGSQIASAGNDNTIKIWNTSTWIADQTLTDHTGSVNCLAWNNDDSLLASGSSDNSVKIWNTSTWIADQTLTDHIDNVNSIVFNSTGTMLASASTDTTVNVWDTVNWGAAIKSLSGHTEAIKTIDWSSTDIYLATGSIDDALKVWYGQTWTSAASTNEIGFYHPSFYMVAQGEKDFGGGANGDAVSIRIKGNNDRVLTSPVGPVGAGLVLGDLYLSGYVRDNLINGNQGNAGHGHGIVFNQGYAVTVRNNTLSDNCSNIYGFASGIFDVTAHSANNFMANTLTKNRIGSYYNANIFVPFNPADTNNLSFPKTIMHNGSFANPQTAIDNIEIKYSQSNEFYSLQSLTEFPLHPDLLQSLTDNDCWS